MGMDPISTALITTAVTTGAKVAADKLSGAGGTTPGAAPGGPNPLTAGLLAPPPEQNPQFHTTDQPSLIQAPERNPMMHATPAEQEMMARMHPQAPTVDSVPATELPPGAPPPAPAPVAGRAPLTPATPPPGLLSAVAAASPTREPSEEAPLQSSTPEASPATPGLLSALTSGLGSIQDRLGDAGENPLFQVGMGLLASGYDPKVNPYLAIQKGLGGVQAGQIAGATADRTAKEAEQQQLVEALLARIGVTGATGNSVKVPASTVGQASLIGR